MKISFFGLFVALILLTSCGNSTPTVDANGNENFDAFYKRFHEDTTFQFQRIEFPMAGLDSDGQPKTWSDENWILLKAPNPKDERLKIFHEKEAEFVKERIILEDVLMMERNFSYDKTSKRWLMTYYADFHMPQNGNKAAYNPADTTTIDSIPSDHPDVSNSDVAVEITQNPPKGKK
jgi:hypothetical protein